jgi:hypothetical protein
MLFFYILILLAWFCIEHHQIENDDNRHFFSETNEQYLIIMVLRYFIDIMVLVFVCINLLYNSQTRKNLLYFANILFHSSFVYFIDRKYVLFTLATPFTLAIIDKIFFKKKSIHVAITTMLLFVFNFVFLIYHEQQYNHIFTFIIISSFVTICILMILFKIFKL